MSFEYLHHWWTLWIRRNPGGIPCACQSVSGEYTVYAVKAGNGSTYEDKLVVNTEKSKTQIVKELIANSDNMIESHNNVVTVKALSSNPETSYTAAISLDDKAIGRAEKFEFEAALTGVTPNNVFEDSVTVTFKDGEDVMKGKEVTIDTNSAAIEVNNRTFVPFRALAEAFGIKVIPTYDENGATADILFNL